ncbi:hypothetical protein GIB67_042646 [Kingdonia uniflora]|uniref:DNA-directed DNA polymerase n=1 Tax=Kingdonia uniflora TaxID=39325 RepID=A0A7J7P243_9MAGN|nr:hypothetical protein GIB67_042646 [Kingdonia uniflora]
MNKDLMDLKGMNQDPIDVNGVFKSKAMLEHSLKRLKSVVDRVSCTNPYLGLRNARMDFKNPYLLCSYYELIILAIMQLLLKYAYNQEFKYAKFTIGYVMRVPSGSGEVSYTIGSTISLNDYSGKAHPNITIYEQIQNFLKVKAKNYEGLFLSGVYIRVYSIDMVVKELDLTSDVIDSQIWDLLKIGVAGGIPQKVQTIAGGRRRSYINYITTIKLSIKERKSFIIDDIKTILINSIHKPYAAGFVMVEQGIDIDSLQDSKFKTFSSENCNHFMPAFEDKRVLMKAQEIYWTEYNIDITSCLTLSSLAMKIFRSWYYNDKEFPIHIPNRNEYEFFRSGYYSGHAGMYKPYRKNLYYYDVNSLYPFVMKTYPMPCGTLVWNGNMRGIDLSEIFGFVQAYIITPENIDKLFLPIRDKNGNNSSSKASSKKKRGLARGLKPLPNGKKKKIDLNSWGQPNQTNSEMNTYTSDIGFQVRMNLPIIYESFKHVPNGRIVLVVKWLEECYDISHVAWFDLKEKIKDSWRRYKYRLNTTLIIGNNPGDLKASPAPEFVPREDWAKSKRNKENREKLIAPCTFGRTSMPITRHKLAELQNTMWKDPKSIRIGPNDATAQKFGEERKGGTRGMGAGMSISLVEKVGHIVNENEELRSNNNELNFSTEKFRKDLDALTKYVGNIPCTCGLIHLTTLIGLYLTAFFAILRIWRDGVGRRLFEGMVVRDVVSWNMLVSGYSLCGDVDAARWVFDLMEENNLVTWSTMVTGYTRVGKLYVARWFFDVMPERNMVSWNAIIAGYTQNEKYSEVIDLFYQMLEVGDGGRGRRVKPNNVTLVSVLSSWNALANMFAKCGCVEECKIVLEKMQERDVISWSIIISGFAMYGQVEEAFRYFLKMLECRVKPNEITFIGLLSACTHAGMVEKGLEYFNQMENEYGVTPKVEHYGCVMDLLSRAGCLNDAEDMINPMPIRPNVIVWGALLGGCRIHKDISRGVHVVQRILEINSDHSGSYVYMANVYASMGRLDDAAI